MESGTFNSMDVRPWDRPQLVTQTSKTLHPKAPLIPRGLSMLDLDCNHNLRIQVKAENITPNNFTATVGSWGDTVVYAGEMNYLELDPACSCIQTGDFDTNQVRSWSSPQHKNSKRINFAKSFRGSAPTVICWINVFDYDHSKNLRLKVFATDIDQNGFTANVESWFDSVMYAGGMSWIAFPSNYPGLLSGSVNTQDVRPWNQPRHENSNTVNFGGVFKGTPKVIMALNEIDYEHTANLRWRCSVLNVTKDSFTWQLNSWGDSVHYSSGCSWIAWE